MLELPLNDKVIVVFSTKLCDFVTTSDHSARTLELSWLKTTNPEDFSSGFGLFVDNIRVASLVIHQRSSFGSL